MSWKGLAKSAAVPLLHAAAPSALMRWLTGPRVPVFMLHRPRTSTHPDRGHRPALIAKDLEFLRRHRYAVSLVDDVIDTWLRGEAVAPKTVCFTVDDGHADEYELAADVFDRFEAPLTYFVLTDFIDGKLWPWDDQVEYIVMSSPRPILNVDWASEAPFSLAGHDERRLAVDIIWNALKGQDNTAIYDVVKRLAESAEVPLPAEAPEAYGPMTWDQLRKLETSGHRIGAHGRSHRILSRLGADESRYEIFGARDRLIEQDLTPARTFGYPTGRLIDFGDREISILKEAGFDAAVATSPGYASREGVQGDERYRLPRFGLPDTMEDFIQYSSWIEALKGRIRAPRGR